MEYILATQYTRWGIVPTRNRTLYVTVFYNFVHVRFTDAIFLDRITGFPLANHRAARAFDGSFFSTVWRKCRSRRYQSPLGGVRDAAPWCDGIEAR